MTTEIRRLLAGFVERTRDIREGSPNAFYSHVDRFCREVEALLAPAVPPPTEEACPAHDTQGYGCELARGHREPHERLRGLVDFKQWEEYEPPAPAAPPPVDPQPEAIGDLRAYGEEETVNALRRKDRDQYQFWQGWNAALDRAVKEWAADGRLWTTPIEAPQPEAYREQLRKHIAAIDGRRPQDGHSERGFSTCQHPDCRAFHPPTMADAAEMLWVVLANVSGGDWTKQSAEWQEAAARWRDNYFAALRATPAGHPPTEAQKDEPCPNGVHVWSHQFGDDWTPERGTSCDCGKKGWGIPVAAPPREDVP
jgi:hypothetical protein